MIGFGRTAVDTLIQPGVTRSIDFELEPRIYDMEELTVREFDKDWKKDLERFIRLFIGTSARADSVVIANPEVLSFSSTWWGRFIAEAYRPLVIENYALGYRITYFLEDFRHSGTVTRWDGESLFEQMAPGDSLQSAVWEKNRKEAFYGSLRHFLLALIQDHIDEEGFILYRHRRSAQHFPTRDRFRTSSGRLIDHSDEGRLFKFSFSGRLEIIYTKAGEDERYIRWERNRSRRPSDRQTSYLELNERPLTIDGAGEILETYGATRFGYFSFLRIADKTPREYLPDGLTIRESH